LRRLERSGGPAANAPKPKLAERVARAVLAWRVCAAAGPMIDSPEQPRGRVNARESVRGRQSSARPQSGRCGQLSFHNKTKKTTKGKKTMNYKSECAQRVELERQTRQIVIAYFRFEKIKRYFSNHIQITDYLKTNHYIDITHCINKANLTEREAAALLYWGKQLCSPTSQFKTYGAYHDAIAKITDTLIQREIIGKKQC
jgi:hypothetical protein